LQSPTQHFAPTLVELERAFRILEQRVPAPIRVPWKDSFVFRYRERTIHQAIIQKLARQVSGLHAVRALHERGLFQEQGMIQRALDELEEDIAFLSFAVIRGEVTERHKQYLEYFYAEEFDDPSDVVGSHKSRGMIKREKIRAYVIQASEVGGDTSRANAVGKVITKTYSGFVHAASPMIMDMVWGEPPRFDVRGETGRLSARGFDHDALNYFYRALVATGFAAKAFGDEDLFDKIYGSARAFEQHLGG